MLDVECIYQPDMDAIGGLQFDEGPMTGGQETDSNAELFSINLVDNKGNVTGSVDGYTDVRLEIFMNILAGTKFCIMLL